MKIKTSQLTGVALDWAVAKCEGIVISDKPLAAQVSQYGAVLSRYGSIYSPSTNWEQGGPIIEKEKISLDTFAKNTWQAFRTSGSNYGVAVNYADSPLVAAMRCFCESEFGHEIEIPDELGE